MKCVQQLKCVQEMELLLYVCEVCKGRTTDVNALICHLEQAHKISRMPQHYNNINKTMIQFWEKEIHNQSYSCCLHVTSKDQRDCFYMDTDVISILQHCQTCKGVRLQKLELTLEKYLS